MEKSNKRDYTLVKSYRVINFLTCLGKVVEKLVAIQLSEFCKAKSKLYKVLMGGRKQRSAIDAAAIIIHKVHEIWENQHIARALLMDVKKALDYVFQARLAKKIANLRIDNNLIGWMQLFLTDRWVELVIDGYTNPKQKVETKILQGSPVSPILFLIYISGMFSQIEEKLLGITCISFVDDLSFLTSGHSISIVAKLLEKSGQIAFESGANNLVTYDISKTEAVLFSKAYHQKLAKQISETQLRFGGETIFFNKKATRWLGVWLDSHFNFAAHVNEGMKKTRAA